MTCEARPVLRIAYALGVVASLLACRGESEPADLPAITVPSEPGHPIARRPVAESRANPPPEPAPIELEQVAGAGYEGWIRPATETDGPGAFTPSAERIAALEAALVPAAAEAMARGDWPDEPGLETYARQYRGYRVDGLDVIAVSLYCPEARHLARRVVAIARGGSCFLHTAYEIETGRFRYFKRSPG